MIKTDWEIREELKKTDPNFRRVLERYCNFCESIRAMKDTYYSISEQERKLKELRSLKLRAQSEMYQIIREYRRYHPES